MIALIAFSTLTLINDAELALGGAPRMMHGEGTVRMASEKVVLKVGEEKTTADCTFHFVNDGPAVKAKMGFPDFGYGAADPEEGSDPAEQTKPPKTGPMTSFKSWVDGKAVATKLERGKEPGEYWHTKTVTFRAKGETLVRDAYALNPSSAIVQFKEKGGSASYAGYVVHTGSSWKGNIGRSEIVFEMPQAVTSAVEAKKVKGADGRTFKVASLPKGTVVYSGMGKPVVKGRTLTFVRTNWRPAKKDDIDLWFDFHVAQ